MTISFEQMQSLLQQQQLHFEKSQRHLIDLLSEKLHIQVDWEPEPVLTSHEIEAECHRLLNLNNDTKMIEVSASRTESQSHHTVIGGQQLSCNVPDRKPPTAFWNGGERQTVRDCAYKIPYSQEARKYWRVCTPRVQACLKLKRTSFHDVTKFAGRRRRLTMKRDYVPVSLQPQTVSAITIVSRSIRTKIAKTSDRLTELMVQNTPGERLQPDRAHACEQRPKEMQRLEIICLARRADFNLCKVEEIRKLYLLNESTNHVMSCTKVNTSPVYSSADNLLERTTLHTWPEPEPPWCWMHVDPGGPASEKLCSVQVTNFLEGGDVRELAT
ncbi:unnamed protein product [Dicrocoelium dendriticum]|nr:unnamed protein product [Dicrocoelium dendriticum]